MRKRSRRRKKKVTTKTTSDMELNELRIRYTNAKYTYLSLQDLGVSKYTVLENVENRHDHGMLLGATINLYWGPG